MKPGRLLTLAVPAALLAIATIGAPATVASEPEGVTLPWNTLDCEFVYATVQFPAVLLKPYLPPGNWRPFSLGNPATANAVATLAFEADVCAEGSGIDGQIEPMLYASTWTYILPPVAMQTDAPFSVLAWDILVPDDERRALLQSAHADVHDGDITISESLRDGATLPFRVDYEIGGLDFAFDIVPTSTLATGSGTPGEWDQFLRGSDGSMTYWRTFWQAHSGQGGRGVIHLDPASWQAEMFGTTVIPAQFQFGTWDYYDGKIVLPS